MLDAANLDVQITLNAFESDLFTAVAVSVVDVAEAADADTSLDRVAVEGLRSTRISEFKWAPTPLVRPAASRAATRSA